MLRKRSLVFTRFDGVRKTLPTLDPRLDYLSRNVWISSYIVSDAFQLAFNLKTRSLAGKFSELFSTSNTTPLSVFLFQSLTRCDLFSSSTEITILLEVLKFILFRYLNIYVDLASQPYTLLNLIHLMLLTCWIVQALQYKGVSQEQKGEAVGEEGNVKDKKS